MPVSTVVEAKPIISRGRLGAAVAAFALLALIVAIVLCKRSFPFTREKVLAALEQSSARDVTIQGFSNSYFPPGCVVKGISFAHRRRKDLPPLITVEELTIKATYTGMIGFHKEVSAVHVKGMHVLIPPPHPDGKRPQVFPLTAVEKGNGVLIKSIDVDGVLLEFLSTKPNTDSYKIDIQKLNLHNVAKDSPISFDAALWDSKPSGHITSTGRFGPWNADDPGSTPVQGSFRYENVKLNSLPGLNGTLGSQGNYTGTLAQLKANGVVDIPDFRVAHSSHTLHLNTSYQADVNATNGDVILQATTTRFKQTAVESAGTITGDPKHHGKTVKLNMTVAAGRVEDLMDVVTQAKVAAMQGAVQAHAAVTLPFDSRPFLERIGLQGEFHIGSATFRSLQLQGSLNKLEESSKGENGEAQTAFSNMHGHVVMANGVATFSDLSFQIEGSQANMRGTYNLMTEIVDLHGTLATTGKLASTTSGVKSVVMTLITPFFHKHQGARIFPIKITGPYGHAQVGLDMGH